MIFAVCKLCGYRWQIRIDNPRQCPSCKKYNWDEEVAPRKKK